MERHRTPRKACDLCYHKRIKCDAQKPRCSNCVVYNSTCTFEAVSRKSRSRKQKLPSNEGIEALQARVKQLEENLSHALEKIDQLEGCEPQETVDFSQSPFIIPSLQVQNDIELVDESLDLPLLQEALPAVEKYLATLNSVIPLFDPGKLLHSLRSMYVPLGQRDRSTWTAINVVLALAYSIQVPSDQATPSRSAAHYLNKAQSVLTEVIMSEPDIINVQIVLGLAMVFQGARNSKPAATLIAIALRLAHELGLHARRSSDSLNSPTTLERDRVFWIAYILDRDISMRTGRPPVHPETDIDIELPSVEPKDGAGLVLAADNSSSFNFFRARVQLASIQGRVYDSMYSVRAQALTVHQRNENLAGLRHMLDDWASRVPSHFRPNAVLRSCNPDLVRAFGILYSTHLSCRALICRTHAMETSWLRTLQELGGRSLQQRIVDPVMPPQGWQVLLSESREYMRLFLGIQPRDPAFIWMTACAYITGAVCLIGNNILHPIQETSEEDQSLAEFSLLLLDEIIQQEPYEPLKKTRNVCSQLLQLAYKIPLENDFLHF